VDLAEGLARGQTIGLYYTVRETIGIAAPLLERCYGAYTQG